MTIRRIFRSSFVLHSFYFCPSETLPPLLFELCQGIRRRLSSTTSATEEMIHPIQVLLVVGLELEESSPSSPDSGAERSVGVVAMRCRLVTASLAESTFNSLACKILCQTGCLLNINTFHQPLRSEHPESHLAQPAIRSGNADTQYQAGSYCMKG